MKEKLKLKSKILYIGWGEPNSSSVQLERETNLFLRKSELRGRYGISFLLARMK